MHIRIGIENNIEGRTLAWALDYPGCFSYGLDEPEALIRLPGSLLKYDVWIKDHTSEPWIDLADFDLRVVERYDTFCLDNNYKRVPDGEGYEINAWFIDDWRPLAALEITQVLKIFRWQREELLAGLSTLDADLLVREFPGQRWNILGIAKHIANAELWYLQRLNLTELSRKDLIPHAEARLEQTAAEIKKIFPTLTDKIKVIGIDGEFWSYRKLIRRTLWHQRDHIEHIKELAFQ